MIVHLAQLRRLVNALGGRAIVLYDVDGPRDVVIKALVLHPDVVALGALPITMQSEPSESDFQAAFPHAIRVFSL